MHNSVPSRILNAVAYPPTMLFIPVELAGLTIAMNVTFMLMGLALFNISPAIWLFTIVGTWAVMAVAYSRDAHIVTVWRARFSWKRRSFNFSPVEDDESVKYVP